MLVTAFLLTITALTCALQAMAFSRLLRYVNKEMNRPRSPYHPFASVILPCKGLDPGFKGNVEKLLSQDYPNFEVIFAVASTEDPAYQTLVELSNSAKIPTKIVVAGINQSRAQKINNQLKALTELSPQSQVLVFVDSDVIAREDFLRHLVEPYRRTEWE
jgi:cellulose synthase/poly-beta-1,6-N-acetylglucosamine synthase-like glycosyltransferase